MSRTTLRSGAGRIGMACYAIWVALALATQGAAPCPTHDAAAAAALAGATMPASMSGMSHDAAQRSGSDHAPHHAHHHTCTCVGCGCCVALMDLCAPARTVAPAPAAVARVPVFPVAERVTAAAAADRRLPFANGPPSGVRVPV